MNIVTDTLDKKKKKFWGPPIWATIHILSLIANASQYEEFLNLLTFLLPCEKCKRNLTIKLTKLKIRDYFKSRKMSFFLGYLIHDLANKQISEEDPKNKKTSPPFDDVFDFYYQRLIMFGSLFWGSFIWQTIHILSSVLLPDNTSRFVRFLNLLNEILPHTELFHYFIKKFPPEPYLRNNDDSFYYSYKIHDLINKKINKQSPDYLEIKGIYFGALGKECDECKI